MPLAETATCKVLMLWGDSCRKRVGQMYVVKPGSDMQRRPRTPSMMSLESGPVSLMFSDAWRAVHEVHTAP